MDVLYAGDESMVGETSRVAWDPYQISLAEKYSTNRVEVCFRTSKTDNKRVGPVVTRTHGGKGVGKGALELLLELLEVHPGLDSHAPLV